MRAVVCTSYGPPEVLQLRELDKPEPRADQVLIRVRATAVTASDIFIRGSQIPWRFRIPMRIMLGLTRPRRPVIGEVLSGEIEVAGRDTKRFKPGDQVYGLTGFSLGAYAEYACLEDTDSKRGCLALKPGNISHEAATVAAYGGLLALQAMERGPIERGHKVLVYGASGTTGTMAIQIAKHWGAEVTAVSGTAHLELLRSLGADAIIDYTKQDTLDPAAGFDFVLDAVGKLKSSRLKESCRAALRPGGRYVSIDDGALRLESSRLETITRLIEAGHVKPVIDRSYPLEAIAEAHAYVERGHKAGGVAVTV